MNKSRTIQQGIRAAGKDFLDTSSSLKQSATYSGKLRDTRGVTLLASYMVIMVLTILGVGFISRAVSERNITQRFVNSVNAFWLSEAGISRALNELRSDFNVTGNDLWSGSLSQGTYSVDVENVDVSGETFKKVTVRGFSPFTSPNPRIIEAMMSKSLPSDFYGYAIYSAGEVDLNGKAYSVDGNVLYAESIDNTGNITGTITYDPKANPLALFEFSALYIISQSQGNVYNAARLQQVQKGNDSFPGSFWYSVPTDPDDPTTGIPNIVYVETDLQLNGNIGTIGGFYLVVGDVITNPNGTYDTDINGNGQIDGVIYTRGTFDINGGGGNLNINGGIWAGEEAELNGKAHISYNQAYMSSLEAFLEAYVDVQIVSWRDTQNPFKVSP